MNTFNQIIIIKERFSHPHKNDSVDTFFQKNDLLNYFSW